MQLSKHSKRKKYTRVVLALVIACIGVGLVVYLFVLRPGFYTNQPTSSSSNDTPKISDQKPTDATSNSVKNNAPSNQTQNQQQSSGGNVNVTITSADVVSGNVVVHTLIEELTSQGTCTIKMKNTSSGTAYEESVGIQALPSSSTCKGFSIPAKSLSKGTWAITISYSAAGFTGVSLSKEIVL